MDIPLIYCISLKERDDRYNHTRSELEKVGLLDSTLFYRRERNLRKGGYGY
jgi:hypothetical protein